MIIVDTSCWIDHMRGRPTPLDEVLGQGRVAMHPFVKGELLLNGLPKKSNPAVDFDDLLNAPLASVAEVAAFIAWAKLAGKGVGYVDTHLLVSAKMIPNGRLMTADGNLHAQAERLGVAYTP